MATNTPWGKSQSKTKYAPGINFYSTASHGGIKLSAGKNAEIPEYMRNVNGWYEEDCEWAKVVVFFRYEGYFNEKMIDNAHRSMMNWNPDEYERLMNCEIPLEMSLVKRDRKFAEDNKNNYVVISAFGDWHPEVPKGFVGVLATLGGNRSNSVKKFLVPNEEYKGHFVIDLNRHKEWITKEG